MRISHMKFKNCFAIIFIRKYIRKREGLRYMFHLGDQVIYGIHGMCRIIELETRKIDRKLIEYYVLEPVEQPGARFFVPTQNQAAVSKLQRVLTRQELDTLLQTVSNTAVVWIDDENQRKMRYRELINSGDRIALICMIRALLRHKQAQEAAGKKFHLCDENFLRDAQKLLSTEFACVLNIAPDQVEDYIKKTLE